MLAPYLAWGMYATALTAAVGDPRQGGPVMRMRAVRPSAVGRQHGRSHRDRRQAGRRAGERRRPHGAVRVRHRMSIWRLRGRTASLPDGMRSVARHAEEG